MTLCVYCLTYPNYNNLYIFKYFQFIFRIELYFKPKLEISKKYIGSKKIQFASAMTKNDERLRKKNTLGLF